MKDQHPPSGPGAQLRLGLVGGSPRPAAITSVPASQRELVKLSLLLRPGSDEEAGRS